MAITSLFAETAEDLMTRDPVSLERTALVEEAARVLTTRGFGAAVVIDEAGRPSGVVTKTDLVIHSRCTAAGSCPIAVDDVMTTAVFSVRPETSAQSVIAHFLALNVHHLFVVDSSGVLVGVISPIDVLKKLG